MRDISGASCGHVACGTVWLPRMMSRHRGGVVACEASLPKILNTLGGRGIVVRIVACCAGELISARSFAGAAQKCFVLAGGATSVTGLMRTHEVDGEVSEVVARLKLCERPTRSIDDRIALKMTLHTRAIAPRRGELCRIYDWSMSMQREMLGRISVAGVAADTSLTKRDGRKAVLCSRKAWLNVGSMAMQAIRIGRKRCRHARSSLIGGRHLQVATPRVVVDRQLKPLSVLLVEI